MPGISAAQLRLIWKILAVWMVLHALFAIYLTRAWPIIHDTQLLHYVAQRMLAGDVIYRDIFEMKALRNN